MAKLLSRLTQWFRSGEVVGVDKFGNRYLACKEVVDDGTLKEKRWVEFKNEYETTDLPVEWASWLHGRRKTAPTPEEVQQLEEYRKRAKMNAIIWEQEEEKRRFRAKSLQKDMGTGDVGPPNLERFIQDMSADYDKHGEDKENIQYTDDEDRERLSPSEPEGTGTSYVPGTWQPPN